VNKALKYFFESTCLALTLLLTAPILVLAQITSDGTTSTEISSPDGNNFDINGGDRAGANLFHSFGDFSVPTRGSANFLNSNDVENIINRVTGGNISSIDGLIQANGNANLFLINPAGIIFGANARLNIGGSFLGSTADSLVFPDGEFSALNAQGKPLLTVNAPIGLNLRDNPQPIVNRSFNDSFNGLQVNTGENISLIGGDINFERGIIFAPGGRIELGGLSAAGTIGINNDGSLSFPESVARGNVSLNDSSIVSVRSGGGGAIAINSKNLEFTQGSRLITSIASGLGNSEAQAGDIIINATDKVTFDGVGQNGFASAIENTIERNSFGNTGNIKITTSDFSLTNGAIILSSLSGEGKTGDITVNASNNISFDGNSGITNQITSTGFGSTGNTNISAKNLSLTNGGRINSFNSGQGTSGNVNVDANNTVAVDGRSQLNTSAIASFVNTSGKGNAGAINLKTKNITITNGGNIFSLVAGEGDSGDLTINASDTVSLDGEANFDTPLSSQIGSSVAIGGIGNSGNVKIATKNLSISNGARIDASTFGTGNAGSIIISATDNISVDGKGSLEGILSQINSRVLSTAIGNGGNIEIATSNLKLSNGAGIDANSIGKGNAGSIKIEAKEGVVLERGDIDSSIFSPGEGNGGEISITAKNVSLFDDAQLSTSSFAKGDAGNIRINASDRINLDKSRVNSDVFKDSVFFSVLDREINAIGEGNSGNIQLIAPQISLLNNASVSTSNLGIGNAGNIVIEASDNFSANNSRITSNIGRFNGTPSEGKVGNIEIAAKNVFFTNSAQLQAGFYSNSQGESGIVSVKATDSISFDGLDSGIFTDVETDAIADGSDIKLEAKSISLSNDAVLFAKNAGNGNGGKIDIISDRLSLDRSLINSSVVSNSGGSINFQIKDLVSLDNKSQISSQATGTGSGGNININVSDGFVVAVPNQDNDIIATAQSGQGGRIAIDATRVYGFDPENIQSTFSAEEFGVILNNGKNDLNSSSANPELSGTVNINTEQLDPVKKTIETPQNIIQPERVVSQTCSANSNIANSSSFIISGRGGLPQDPTKTLKGSWIRVTETTTDKNTDRSDRSQLEQNKPVSSDEIIPARGMIINQKGQVILTRYPTPSASDRGIDNFIYCPGNT
jgi:filamentous hemagglutinin family protein